MFYFSTLYLLEYTIQQTNFSWHTPLWAEIYYVAEKIIGHPPTPAYMPHTKQRAPPGKSGYAPTMYIDDEDEGKLLKGDLVFTRN